VKRLMTITDAPRHQSWWRNYGHGRKLVCRCSSLVMFVPAIAGYCTHCREPLLLLTADPSASERLQASA
jgi:hypothetical protein